MYILSIIPIARGIPISTLSYYSSELLAVGTVVEIPLGKQFIFGLVYSSQSLIEAKTSIKQATFSLKKLKRVVGISPLTIGVAEGLREASIRTLTPVGSLAACVVHELFFDLLRTDTAPTSPIEVKAPLAIYGTLADRTDQYKRIIRTAFAEKKSVVIVAPSIRQVEFWYTTLQKGILTHSVLLHSKCTKRHNKSMLTLLKQSERPLFIAATPHFAVIPRDDIATIILEEESSTLYKTHDRYEADMRVVLSCIATASHIQTIFGDTMPRFETLHSTQNTHLSRSYTPDKLMVVEVEPYRTILPSETIELLRYAQKHKKSVFIYTNRKGLAPLSRCSDCGTVVDCPTCKLPMVLRYKLAGGERERLFICTHCAETLPPTHTCTYCGSWNITPVSIGTESIADTVSAIVGQEHLITIDDDLSPDGKDIESLIDETQKHKWFVMVGTQKLLPYIKSIDYIVIPFFDRLLSIASPYTVEESLRLLFVCNEKTKDRLIICTKQPTFPITRQLATKKFQDIIDEDLVLREQLNYPPFGHLLKLSVTVPSGHKDHLVSLVDGFFTGCDITMLPVRRVSPESMKLLCVWVIQTEHTYLEDHGDELQGFLESIRFPLMMDTHPNRI